MTENWTVEDLAEQFKRNPDLARANAGVKESSYQPDQEKGQGVDTPKLKGANKFHVSPKEDRTYNGIVYHSKKEASFAEELDLRKKAGEISFWLRQVPFALPGGSVYRLDFMTFYGPARAAESTWRRVDFIEVKGKLMRKNKAGKYVESELPLGKLKRKQAEAIYGIHIIVV